MAEVELPQYEVDLQAAKDEFRGDSSDDNKQAVRDAKLEARYQRWLDRNGFFESIVEKVLKERGVVHGRFLEQWILDRWLAEDEGPFSHPLYVNDEGPVVFVTAQEAYDELVDAAHKQATEALKGSN